MKVKKVEKSELSELLSSGWTIADIQKAVREDKEKMQKAPIRKHLLRFISAGTVLGTIVGMYFVQNAVDENNLIQSIASTFGGMPVIAGVGGLTSLMSYFLSIDASSDARHAKENYKKFNEALEEAEEQGLIEEQREGKRK